MKTDARLRSPASATQAGSLPVSGSPSAATPSGGAARIMIVDDHPMTRDGLTNLINKQTDLKVCCEAAEPSEALQKIAKGKPNLILTDITMPGRGGIEFIKDVVVLFPGIPILVVSMHDELIYAERALHAGARGYIMKEEGGEKMLEAIRCVLSGQIYVSKRMASTMLDNFAGGRPRGSQSPIERLSDREFEIFQLIGQGKSTQAIAGQLHLSPKTVDTHRAHIKEKLELSDTTSLIRHAIRWFETQEVRPPALKFTFTK
jgi:DNA-binding NarL/FixJ family response regulator